MNRLSHVVPALAPKNFLHLCAIEWMSVIGLLGLLVQPAVIRALGPRYWLLVVLPCILLLFTILTTFVVLWTRDAQVRVVSAAPGRRRTGVRAKKPG